MLVSFQDKPFAAASIGQVHLGVLSDGREVAMKIQVQSRREHARECVRARIIKLYQMNSNAIIFPVTTYLLLLA